MMKKYVLALIPALILALPATAQKEITANVENPKVAAYLDAATYKYLTSSCVSKYAKDIVRADEHPAPAIIPLDQAAEEPMMVVVRNVLNPLDNYSAPIEAGATEAAVYNLIPGQRYEYEVSAAGEDGEARIVEQGFVNVEGRVRMINLPTVHNLRDLGGKHTDDGEGELQYGLIFRGSTLNIGNVASKEDIQELRRLGMDAELDLRILDPIPSESALGPDAAFLHLPLTDLTYGYIPVYNEELKQAYLFVLDNLRNRRPVYIHCIFGADRTGTLCALIEASIGICCDDVYKDFELTSFSSFVGLRDKRELNWRLFNGIGYRNNYDLKEYMRNYMTEEMGIAIEDIEDMTAILLGTYQYPGNPDSGIHTIEAATPPMPETGDNLQPNPSAPQLFNLAGLRIGSQTSRGLVIQRNPDGTVRKKLLRK